MNIWNRINKKERIEQWVEWCEIPIIIKKPEWHDDRIWRAYYDIKKEHIVINGKQSEKEIIKSIIHEICHWKNNDKPNDPDKWDREDRCIRIEKEWKKEPGEIIWK